MAENPQFDDRRKLDDFEEGKIKDDFESDEILKRIRRDEKLKEIIRKSRVQPKKEEKSETIEQEKKPSSNIIKIFLITSFSILLILCIILIIFYMSKSPESVAPNVNGSTETNSSSSFDKNISLKISYINCLKKPFIFGVKSESEVDIDGLEIWLVMGEYLEKSVVNQKLKKGEEKNFSIEFVEGIDDLSKIKELSVLAIVNGTKTGILDKKTCN